MIFKAEQQEIPEVKPLLKKKEKKRLSSGDRWAVVAVFLATVVLSAAFYFKSELSGLRQKITAPLIISNVPEEKKFDPSPVLKEIGALTANLRGTYGVYVYRFGDGEEYGIFQKETFPAASLMKLPVILALYQADFLETKYKLIQADKRSGAGILQSRTPGTVYTYRQLAEFMGQYSDNTANNVLVKILGAKKIQETIDLFGMKKTNFAKYETTPEDIGIFFRKLYQGNLVNQVNQEEILRFLTKTSFEDRIPAGVPEGVRVAHKIGTEIGVFSDAGIVFAKKPFVLVILSKAARESEAKEILPKITRVVWEFETK